MRLWLSELLFILGLSWVINSFGIATNDLSGWVIFFLIAGIGIGLLLYGLLGMIAGIVVLIIVKVEQAKAETLSKTIAEIIAKEMKKEVHRHD